MAWHLPPLPAAYGQQPNDYSGMLYKAVSGIGDVIAGNRDAALKQRIADQTAATSDRNYALDLQKFALDEKKAAAPSFTEDVKNYQFATQTGFKGSFTD